MCVVPSAFLGVEGCFGEAEEELYGRCAVQQVLSGLIGKEQAGERLLR